MKAYQLENKYVCRDEISFGDLKGSDIDVVNFQRDARDQNGTQLFDCSW